MALATRFGEAAETVELAILAWLDFHELALIGMTSKELRQRADGESLWKGLCLSRWPELKMRSEDKEWKDCFKRKWAETPTRFDDIQQELRGVGWYQCPNGHMYAIGECRLAMVVARCPTCGCKVGGMDHRMLGSNARLQEAAVARTLADADLHRIDRAPDTVAKMQQTASPTLSPNRGALNADPLRRHRVPPQQKTARSAYGHSSLRRLFAQRQERHTVCRASAASITAASPRGYV
eukprot:CAMPEP_0175949888 /NCGR_PEP_ID=MMETSP0108-20121206/29290_1 /TAXON_ID=195067 ORGANISM="Goniomonas pacifica, Strain CCMP1869" /NCGR_SAMPLE_ID=MMETSP0108 /ASSEMBLY_ACC=CAM_ASM_000204 /LENGTH=236 /DNA_ID=CAMNT_0017275877 /DNA_START=8 /DNA_END=716 /DNA_ORIENTATION=-